MKKSIEKLREKLKAQLKDIKNIYIGDPILIPASCLPCISIDPVKTETNIIDNQRDSHIHYISVALIIDARQYFGKNPKEMVGTSYLMEKMEEEDADGNIKENTILGVLRDNLTLESNRTIQNISTIDYTVRRRSEELITLEAVANLQIEYIVNR